MNLSPIFGLYPDEDNEVFSTIESPIYRMPPLEATDHLGVVSRLWPIADEHLINDVIGLMSSKPVFIADGHHRYETGLRYLEERKAAGEVIGDEAAPNFTMMMLVSMSDPGLIILPTHRLISGLPDLTAGKLQTDAGAAFPNRKDRHGRSGGQGDVGANRNGRLAIAARLPHERRRCLANRPFPATRNDEATGGRAQRRLARLGRQRAARRRAEQAAGRKRLNAVMCI